MPLVFDRKTYFDMVRDSLFYGKLTQQQVDGQEFILDTWEDTRPTQDIRWLGYELATSIHETAATMWPIEEYGKGKGQPYGVPDSVTKETYYGRGFVQLTWKENYLKMTPIVDPQFPSQPIDLAKNAAQALEPHIAAAVMFEGMEMGMFRSDGHGPQTLERYFNLTVDDAYGAREIINGDKKIIPSWSSGVSIGNLIKGYHNKFCDALTAARDAYDAIKPPPEEEKAVVRLEGNLEVWLNGVQIA